MSGFDQQGRPRIAPAEFWENVEAHVNLLMKNGFRETAAILALYEKERTRMAVAIDNLESQLIQLGSKVGEHEHLVQLLKSAGMDEYTILRTDEIFGDP